MIRQTCLQAVLLMLSLSSSVEAQTFKHLGDLQPNVKRPQDRRIWTVGLSHNGMTLAVVLNNFGEIWCILYDVETLQETARWEPTKGTGPVTLLFSHDSKTLIVHSMLGQRPQDAVRGRTLIEFWDIATKKVRLSLPLSDREANAAHLTADGKTLVLLGEKHILLVDAITGKPKARFPEYSTSVFTHSVLSPDGKQLAIKEHKEHWVSLYDLTSGKLTASFNPFPKAPNSSVQTRMAFSLDSKHLTMLRSPGNELATFAVKNGKEISRLSAKATICPEAMTFAPNGKALILAGGLNGPGIEVLSAQSGKAITPVVKKKSTPYSAVISADRRTVALAERTEVRLWRVEVKKEE